MMLRVWKPDAPAGPAAEVAGEWIAELSRTRGHAAATAAGYRATLAAWIEWGGGPDWPEVRRRDLAAFFEWLYGRAARRSATNPGRVVNKARAHLAAVLRWAVDAGRLGELPELPRRAKQRTVAGRWHYSGVELAALYAAAGELPDPPKWAEPAPRAWYWQAAIVVWWFYGADTQAAFAYQAGAKPMLWSGVHWSPPCPDRSACLPDSPDGWLSWSRAKTGRRFTRPMAPQVRAHLRRLAGERQPDGPVFRGGSKRPADVWRQLVAAAELGDKVDSDGRRRSWVIQDMRKTCATDCELTRAGSAAAVLGHAVGVTARHYADLDLVAFETILARATTAPACFTIEGKKDGRT